MRPLFERPFCLRTHLLERTLSATFCYLDRMSNLFTELKRRNVFRVALAYIALAWLILQVADIVFENIGAPAWVMQVIMFVLAVGFPIAVLFAWAYELTPDGIKREHEVDRSQSITQQTGQKLNRTIIVVLLAAVGFLLVDKFLLQDAPTTVAVTDKSVAVLPFVPMSRGENDEFFADGLTEEILNSLTRVQDLLVTARTSAFHFKGKDIPIPEIAEQLRVAHVVEGSVRRDGDRLRVTAQLIRASDGFHLWSKNYDRETADTFGVQTDIAEQISASLGVVLDEASLADMRDKGLRSPEAYILLQQAYALFEEAHDGRASTNVLLEMNGLLEEFLELEPTNSAAYTLHSDYYTHLLIDSFNDNSVSAEEQHAAYDRMVSDLDNALRFAGTEASRLSNNIDLSVMTGNWTGIRQLIADLDAENSCISSSWMDVVAIPYGMGDTIEEMGRRFAECDPLFFHGWRIMTTAQIWSGNLDEAIATANKGFEVAPNVDFKEEIVFAHLAAGRPDDAERVIRREIRDPEIARSMAWTVKAARGDYEAAKDLYSVAQAGSLRKTREVAFLARVGEREQANELAAGIDSQPYGHLLLMLIPNACKCGAPWDLEATPNFAKLVNDAGLTWPPTSPINWPLKDW